MDKKGEGQPWKKHRSNKKFGPGGGAGGSNLTMESPYRQVFVKKIQVYKYKFFLKHPKNRGGRGAGRPPLSKMESIYKQMFVKKKIR